MLKLYNTLGRKKEDFEPLKNGEVSMYSCGPTVYNYPHVGNLRAMVFADTLYRWLKFGEEYAVEWVMNITDVDDKTIRDSVKKYPELSSIEALKKFTRYYEDIFFKDLEALGISRDSFLKNPRATEYIKEMQDLILGIGKHSFTKVVDGSVFFDVKKYALSNEYGRLLNLNLEGLEAGRRTLADEIEKDEVQDFALWKAKKDDEPFWDFDFNGENLPGRPGWHIECSAMSESLLGLPFDIHTGGVDLVFPHHENEIAQAQAGLGSNTASFWCHNEHLMAEGRKMSKSLGNFYTLQDLIEKGFSAEVIRFFFVINHYKSKTNLSDESLEGAKNSLKKICNAIRNYSGGENSLEKKKQEFICYMQDDLNTPLAVAVLYDVLKGDYIKEEVLDFFEWVGNIFGVCFLPKSSKIPLEVLDLAEKRQEARKNKDFSLSDSLRDKIASWGYEMRDEGEGFILLPLDK